MIEILIGAACFSVLGYYGYLMMQLWDLRQERKKENKRRFD